MARPPRSRTTPRSRRSTWAAVARGVMPPSIQSQERSSSSVDAPILRVDKLDVYYGRAHALQSVSLELPRGVLGVVGRNGMGKTTLCNAITGLVRASGSVKLAGEEILGLAPNVITAKGVGYVPQGRRLWPALSVDEHLRLARRRGPWTVERNYPTVPRLVERAATGRCRRAR